MAKKNSILNKYNAGSLFDYEFTGTEEFVKLSELDPKRTYLIRTLYINTKGMYDDHPVCVADIPSEENEGEYIPTCVDLPAHLTERIKEFINDPEVADLVNKEKCAFQIRTYEYEKKGKKGTKPTIETGYTIDFVEV